MALSEKILFFLTKYVISTPTFLGTEIFFLNQKSWKPEIWKNKKFYNIGTRKKIEQTWETPNRHIFKRLE